MERCRQRPTILPLGGLHQSACDESIHLPSPQLNLDAQKPTPAALTVVAHPFDGRGKAGPAINHLGFRPMVMPISVSFRTVSSRRH
jgi:hypothetical protein